MTKSSFLISSAAVSDKGLSEKRPQNEDSFLLLKESGMFAVADGVGGAQAGDVASKMAVEVLEEAFINLGEGGDAEDRMRAAIQQANASIYQMSRDLPSLSTMATTLVALHVNDNIATIGHVGDSRLYRLDAGGRLFRETQDHSVVEEEVRAGRMSPSEAANHPSRNVISRALGAESTVEIDMKTIMFEAPSTFLVCSDGVTRHIPDEELRDLLASGNAVSDICDSIKSICYERGAEDNLTAVIVKVDATVQSVQTPFELDLDDELPTVATARAAVSGGTVDRVSDDLAIELDVDLGSRFSGNFELDDPDQTDDPGQPGEPDSQEAPEPPEEFDDLDDAGEIVIPTRDDLDTGTPAETVENEAVKDVRSYRVDEESGSSMIGKILSGAVWLLVGVLLGALGYFLYTNSLASPATDPAAENNKVVLELEQKRRLVDLDPAKYIAANSTAVENSAGNHYMIGRAYLLQKNYGAAKTSFENASKYLSESQPLNREILKHDIAVGMAIALDEAAQKAFEESEAMKSKAGPDSNNNAAPDSTPQGD